MSCLTGQVGIADEFAVYIKYKTEGNICALLKFWLL